MFPPSADLPRAWPAAPFAAIRELAARIDHAGGCLRLVGGCVRDALLGASSADFDAEVFGLSAERLQSILADFDGFSFVGKSFPVWRSHRLNLDLSLPRHERQTGPRHQDFAITVDPGMSLRDAAARRDFTLNAIFYDPRRSTIESPCNGLADLQDRILRHTSPQFGEDALRVLRGMQFAARFELSVAPSTVALCRTLTATHLPTERIGGEWEKLILQGKRPSHGLRFLHDCGWTVWFPELAALRGCPQDPLWHPEGDVWVHTLHAVDAFARNRSGDRVDDLVVGLAVLCHDLGKATHTRFDRGRWRSPEHEQAGTEPTRRFLARLTRELRIIDPVLELVRTHMRPHQLHQAGASDAAVRRLARQVGRIDRLVRVALADAQARPPLGDDGFPAGPWLLERAQSLEVADSRPKPLVRGRDLIALGLPPGPEMGQWLSQLFEYQLDGAFHDTATARAFTTDWLRHRRLIP